MPAHLLKITTRNTSDPDQPANRRTINYARPETQEFLRRLIYSATRQGQSVFIEALDSEPNAG